MSPWCGNQTTASCAKTFFWPAGISMASWCFRRTYTRRCCGHYFRQLPPYVLEELLVVVCGRRDRGICEWHPHKQPFRKQLCDKFFLEFWGKIHWPLKFTDSKVSITTTIWDVGRSLSEKKILTFASLWFHKAPRARRRPIKRTVGRCSSNSRTPS